jgi:hypothetical protein
MTLGRIYDLWGRTRQVIVPRPEPHPLLLDDDEGEARRVTMLHFHGGRFGVPASGTQAVHNEGRAIDVFAKPGSGFFAPAPGRIVEAHWVGTPDLPGGQIRGVLRMKGDGEIGFVAAHLRNYRKAGSFPEGAKLGVIVPWPKHPNSAHVHIAFNTGDVPPPPANIGVLKAFNLLP